MVWVICAMSLMSNSMVRVDVQVKALLVSDNKEEWAVDITDYVNKHPEFKEYNNFVVFVNNNECLYAK